MASPRVLVAMRCDADRRLMSFVLEQKGLEVCEAPGAPEVLQAARQEGVGLILLDRAFWYRAEPNVLAELKSSERTRLLPVVLVGQPRDQEEVTKSIMEGACNWVLRKGFDIKPFVTKVQDLLAAAPPAPAEPDQSAATPPPPKKDQSLVEKLTKEMVVQELWSSEHLPAFDFSLAELVTTTCAKDHATEHIADLALRDPMVALALLRRVQTGQHARRNKPITDLQEAASALGSQCFYRMIESIPSLACDAMPSLEAWHFWVHSVGSAKLAGLLSRKLNLGSPPEMMSIALLHDIGHFVMANCFPKHLNLLLEKAEDQPVINVAWEKQLIGAHHGEIAAWAFEYLGLPEVYQQVALLQHAPDSVRQTLQTGSRVAAMVAQTACQMATVLFPGDPPLVQLLPPSEELTRVVTSGGFSVPGLMDEARKIMAELLTEMVYLFPGAASSPNFYRDKPLETVAYYEPTECELDMIKTFFEVRCEHLCDLNREHSMPDTSATMIINLSHMPDVGEQLEVLIGLGEVGALKPTKGIVLLPGAVDARHQGFVPKGWRFLSLPTHPYEWMHWLATPQAPSRLRVA